MDSEPDPDWYLDHVLVQAEQGSAATIRVDEVTRWQAWWRAQARAVGAESPGATAAVRSGFVLTAERQRELGITRATARGLVRRGQWSAPVRGAVAVLGPVALAADNPDRWTVARRGHALLCAATSAVTTGHLVCGRSAAVLSGLPLYCAPTEPELGVPLEHPGRRPGATIGAVEPADVSAWFGVPHTSVARTVVDVARSGRRDGIVLADAALRTQQVTRTQLAASLAQAAGWPGVRQARELLALADPRAESPLESLLRLAAHDSGLPAPELQFRIPVPGRREPYRVDLCWPEHRLIVEADGRTKYRPDRPDDDPLWAEKRREDALRRLGYRVERVIWADVVHTWPATYALLAAALGR